MKEAQHIARISLDAHEIEHVDTWRGTTYDNGTFDRSIQYVDRRTGNSVIIREPARGEPYADPVRVRQA